MVARVVAGGQKPGDPGYAPSRIVSPDLVTSSELAVLGVGL